MAAKQPAMSSSDLPVVEALDRATGARRVGFGEYEYLDESGRRALSAAGILAGTDDAHARSAGDFSVRLPDLMARLGENRAGKVCLYLTRLAGVDRTVLRALLELSLAKT